jgi:hypothetical protein
MHTPYTKNHISTVHSSHKKLQSWRYSLIRLDHRNLKQKLAITGLLSQIIKGSFFGRPFFVFDLVEIETQVLRLCLVGILTTETKEEEEVEEKRFTYISAIDAPFDPDAVADANSAVACGFVAERKQC